jgi:serine/threonine-protein kinase ATR
LFLAHTSLGDRHIENLLFDERSGDVVHVDFNCLFEQGKSLPTPEIVPFRLTHNMVDAMGPSGYDGVYRISCEKTLQVCRDNMESLASVLEGFIHDPLVEWSKSKRVRPEAQQNDKAQAILMQIKRKLSGTDNANPQSVQGQVEALIQAATNSENLAKMYIGWSAYL